MKSRAKKSFFQMSAILKFDFQKRKQLRFSEVNLNYTKRHNFACDNYIFPKTRGNKNKQWTHSTPLKNESLLYDFQSGFRPSFYTDTFCLDLQKKKKKKTFGTIGRKIIFGKLRAIEMTENSVKWFHSYLTGRYQVIDIDGELLGPK